ncbi:MAG: NAD(P)H-dependent glycerol-3-phosphate dehydrogenase [Acidimicrobiales bacterium]
MGGAVSVVGAGSWGTAVAALLARRGPTTMWARSPDLATAINRDHFNRPYLDDVALPDALTATSELAEAVDGASVVLVAVPSHGFRAVVADLAPHLGPDVAVVSLTKGIEAGTNRRMSEIVRELLPDNPVGILTGPNLAREIAEGQPAASVVALEDAGLADLAQEALHGSTYRVYTSTDVIGCEVAGAVKNVIAVAAGMSDGLGFGENTRALLITRGLAELGRVGLALGGQPLTFGGLAGVGDLVVTCTSPRSRNRSVGLAIGRGEPLDEVLSGMLMVAEGVKTARPLVKLAGAAGVEMPIAEQVAAIVEGSTTPLDALVALMGRAARAEWDEDLLRGLLG